MRYTTTDGPSKALNAIQDGSLGDKMGIAVSLLSLGGNQIFFGAPSMGALLRVQVPP